MLNTAINGQELKNILLGSVVELKNNADEVNKLNVFPVPDGDTGFNMLSTIEGGANAIKNLDSLDAGFIFKTFSNGTQFSARGNSGVILSQFIKGVETGLASKTEITAKDLSFAFTEGVKRAYSAVQKPVEGTILTVFREACDYASEKVSSATSVEDYLKYNLEQALKTLVKTKEILPALKEADVVDSGGAGYCYILKGMIKAIIGEAVTLDYVSDNQSKTNNVNYDLFTRDSEMVYGYCTEFILRLQTAKCNVDEFDVSQVIDKLTELGGDSIVAYKNDDILKVHVHILNPGSVLNYCQKFGEFLNIKIENMTFENIETTAKLPKKQLAVVSVVNGAGTKQLFTELGCDVIVDGGQTSNPSAQDFIEAFKKINAENIIVFPNNSNVILSAKQAQSLYEGANVYVIETKTVQEGYVALSVVNSTIDDMEMQLSDIKSAIESVLSIDVTYAIRDAKVGGVEVKKDNFMAISRGKILATCSNCVQTALNAVENIEDLDDLCICTVFYGKDLSLSDRKIFEDEFCEKFPDITLNVYHGEQEVYGILIALE